MIGDAATFPMPDWLATLVGLFLGVGALMLGIGYLVGQWRSGGSKAVQEALLGAQAELSISSQARERLETEVREYRDQVQRLTGKIEQLQEENSKLNKLVMGEVVPPAMQQAMEANAAAATASVLAAIDERFANLEDPLHQIAQGIARLLTER